MSTGRNNTGAFPLLLSLLPNLLPFTRKLPKILTQTIRTFRIVVTDTQSTVKKKGKAVPLQAWSGPEGSRKLRFPYYVTTAQDGGKVISLTHRPLLPPGNTPGTHFC